MTTTLEGNRAGETYNAKRDKVRLNRQAKTVYNLMRDGRARTLHTISQITREPESSISARLRDFRKARFGGHMVHREHIGDGCWIYRLEINPHAEMDT